MYTKNKIETFRPARKCRHGPSRVLVIFCLILAINASLPSVSLADIKVEPGTTVQVGEEVFFDGTGVTIPGAELLPNGMIKGSYEWDFGDGSTLKNPQGGITTTHFYMRPGTYPVTLSVTDINGKTAADTIIITVEGEYPKLPPSPSPDMILELKFENNLDDTSASGLTSQWQDGEGSFVGGIEGQAAELTNGSYIEVSDPTGILSGMDELTISVWAKKATDDSTGYLIDNWIGSKDGAYYIWLSGPQVFRVQFKTTDDSEYGSKLLQAFPSQMGNKMWHQYILTYDGTIAKLYLDEKELYSEAHTGTIVDVANNLLIGKDFDGQIDEVRMYNKALTPEELFKNFELWHADFHGHTAQYIYAQIPGVFIKEPTNKIKATITGDNGFSKVIYNKDNLQSEENFLLNNSELPAGNYTLMTQILDVTGNILDQIKEKFVKPYDGIPRVGIDENNAIRVNGKLFFPVNPFIEHYRYVPAWKAGGYINSLYGEGYYAEHNLDSWKYYLDVSHDNDLLMIGPARFEGKGPVHWVRNSDINKLAEYVNGTKDHPALLMWMWHDEPELGGPTYGVPSPVVRSWTYKSHQLDSQHLVATNYVGSGWIDYDEPAWRGRYEYLYNENQFGGKKTHVTDILGIDYYPIEYEYENDGVSMEKLVLILNRLREENYDLLPYMSFVETANIKTDISRDYGPRSGPSPHDVYSVTDEPQSVVTAPGHFEKYTFEQGDILEITATGDSGHAIPGIYTIAQKIDSDRIRLATNATNGSGDDTNVTLYLHGTPPPTAEQLRMLTWLNVVHGVKGINWFQMFTPTSPENFAVMAEFLDHITKLTTVVLGPEANKSVQDNASQAGNRVDTMIREDGEDTWIFAVRLTEVGEVDNPPTDVTFTIDGLTSGMTVIEPGEFSQSIGEYKGDPIESKRIFSFTLENAPIIPGSVQIAGQYLREEVSPHENRRIYLYDDGNGNLYGFPNPWAYFPLQYKDMTGTVNYETGEVYVDFGVSGPGDDILILQGEDMVRATYRPVKGDRIIPHTGNTFTDTFAPNAVHIYRIGASSSGNHPPVLEEIGNKSVDENSLLTFDVNATDPDGDTITYSATGTAIDAGATFSGQTFSWTPNSTQAGPYQATFTATAGGQTDSETINITVYSGNNTPPVLASIGPKLGDEGLLIGFTASASDSDVPANSLTFSLINAPAGASIDPVTGYFTWIPTEAQGPDSYDVTVRVTDDGAGNLYDEEVVTITVNEVNASPTLSAIDSKFVDEGAQLTFTASASDTDVPGNTLTFSLFNAPVGASINPVTGVFTWTPAESQGPDSYDVTVRVTDDGAGNLYDEESMTITVVPDETDPTVTNLSPQADSIQAPLNTLVILDITDSGDGVDANSVTVKVNNNIVYTGNTNHYPSADGDCRRLGTKADYRFIYHQWKQNFDFDQPINVTVNATDLAGNIMDEYSYSFKSEMRSFGENKILHSGSNNENWGPLTTVADSSGNIWVAWPQGVVGNRDIYVGKLVAGTDSFVSSGVVPVTIDIPDQGNPVIAVDSSDKLYLAWQDNRRGNWDIYVSTSNDWSAEIRVTDSNDNQTKPAIVIDSNSPNNNAYIVWEDDRHGNQDIYVAKSSDGFATKMVSQITSDDSNQVEPAIAADWENTIYVVWTDTRNGGKNDIYGAASNSGLWTNIPIVTEEESQSNPAIATEAQGSVLHFVWLDDTPGDDDIYYASTSDGLPSSSLTGRSIIDDPCEKDQLSPVIITTGYTGNDLRVFACWRDERWADADLFFDELSSGDVNNVFVGDDDTSTDQSEPAIGIDGYGQPYIVWINERTDICYAGSTFIEPVVLASSTASVSSKTTVGTVPGSITNIDDVSTEVPQGAYLCDVKVTISRIRNPHKPPSNNRTFLYEFGPSGTTFSESEPVTITIPYNATTLVSSPSAYWYNPLTGLYSQEGITDVEVIQISSGLYALRFKTTHFSIFGGGGPFGGGGGGGGCSMSPNSQGSIVEFLLPYIGLTVVMTILKLRDRRKNKMHDIAKSEC